MAPGIFSVLLLLGCVTLSEVLAGPAARSSCPPGWFYYKSNCYGYFRFKTNWFDAEFECQAYGHGAHLASILDSAEASIIASHILAYQKNQPVWIGLHDPEQNRRWKWNDGSMYNYRSWRANQPDNTQNNEYCVELSCSDVFLKWNDYNCNTANHFICKFKP
ncbi:regenerating islet-derived protein 4-like [Rhinatrema bivittatum]|uniref:regenerating islet-derived protein 4-like n=1 Tax=Rhinatrema bivittatum TaxID=194408 RepID=UPI0011289948|nr:regenerating islet-derived protein 4-like [Rhinatrema bivittatum]